jgi:hypothetical protein
VKSLREKAASIVLPVVAEETLQLAAIEKAAHKRFIVKIWTLSAGFAMVAIVAWTLAWFIGDSP